MGRLTMESTAVVLPFVLCQNHWEGEVVDGVKNTDIVTPMYVSLQHIVSFPRFWTLYE